MRAPIRQFIVKVHSRCNLSCTYCYVYHHVDQSWRDRPRAMSATTITQMAQRIGEHVRAHDLRRIVVVLHGGEPMLAGAETIDRVAGDIITAVMPHTQVDVTLQTNGVLLDERFLDVFHRRSIGVGVSVDGGTAEHNRFRVTVAGQPSFDQVRQALTTLARPEHRAIYAGILCTVDLANDPIEVYEGLLAFRPPQLDLLLPLGNWVHRPPGKSDNAAAPYADWLATVFDRWFDAPRRETGIRLFESIIALLLGHGSDTEAIGLNSANAITVETDGSLEVTDALKTTAPGLGATGLNVKDNTFDEAMVLHSVRATQRWIGNLAEECLRCPVMRFCGGGQYSHRYGEDGTFRHRSVYCTDLYQLISHVQRRLGDELDARRRRAA